MPRDTRDRILDAASRLFSERGFDGTAVADVLAGAGVRSGSLYHFFPSKEALAEAVVARCADRAREALLDPAEAAATDPLEHFQDDAFLFKVRGWGLRDEFVVRFQYASDGAVASLLTTLEDKVPPEVFLRLGAAGGDPQPGP